MKLLVVGRIRHFYEDFAFKILHFGHVGSCKHSGHRARGTVNDLPPILVSRKNAVSASWMDRYMVCVWIVRLFIFEQVKLDGECSIQTGVASARLFPPDDIRSLALCDESESDAAIFRCRVYPSNRKGERGSETSAKIEGFVKPTAPAVLGRGSVNMRSPACV